MIREAQLFEELDGTTSTKVKVDALARYFREADDADKLWTIALLTGRRPKRPVNSTQLRRWAAELTGIDDELFEASYHVVGDFAETVTLLVRPDVPVHRSLTEWVRYVEELQECDEATKEVRVKAAWKGLADMELFIFNKIITGAFRIGVEQRMLVKGLAQATGVEEGVLAHRLMGGADPHRTDFHRLIFADDPSDSLSRPYPFFLAYGIEGPEGTASGTTTADVERLGDPTNWSAEDKWDGIRGQLIVRGGQHALWTRGEELVTDKYPEFGTAPGHFPDGTVLDGELIAWHEDKPLPFAAMQKRIGRKSPGRKILSEVPVVFMAYDILEHEGTDVRTVTFAERRSLLRSVVEAAAHPSVLLSAEVLFATWEGLAAHRAAARGRGVEGVMLKRKDSAYGLGRRRGDWWKWKVDPMSIDAVLTFSMQGHGRRANLYTDHTFGLWRNGELVTFAKAYSGLTDEEMGKVDAFVKRNTIERFGPVRQVKPELVFEIAFEGVSASPRHKSGVAVRFPRIARWRHDKRPADANTLQDLERLIAVSPR